MGHARHKFTLFAARWMPPDEACRLESANVRGCRLARSDAGHGLVAIWRKEWDYAVLVNRMSYYFEFDATNRVLRGTFTGRVTDEEVMTFYRLAGEYAAQLNPSAGIVDLAEVASFEVSVQTMRQLAKSPPAMPERSHPRVIVAVSPHIFGMARVFEFEGESTRPNLHVVRTREEAWAIIGVQEFEFEPVATAINPSNVDSTC